MHMRGMTGKAILLVAALFACGCVRSESKLSLHGDGTADFEISYSMSEQTVTQLKAVRRLRDELHAAAGETNAPLPWQEAFLEVFSDPTEEGVREELAKYEPYGVTVRKVEIESRGGWRYARLQLECRDLAALAGSHMFKEYGFSMLRGQDDTVMLSRDQDGMAPGVNLDFADPETARTLGPVLAGFYVKIVAQVPGRIVKSNASRTSLYTAEWEFDFSRDRDAVTSFLNHKLRLVFQGKGMSLPQF